MSSRSCFGRFPAAALADQGEHLHPGEQLAGQCDDLSPGLVLGEALEGRLRSPVSLAFRIRSSQRARRRCRNSRPASWLFLASVATAHRRAIAPARARAGRVLQRLLGLPLLPQERAMLLPSSYL
jgi:hypothetical protein